MDGYVQNFLYSEYLFILFPVGVHGINKHIALNCKQKI